jgi:UDP-N-acetyl-D-mannosaminuronate dehydrogenase
MAEKSKPTAPRVVGDSKEQTVNRKIGMIGIGIMGSAMSANLLKAGYELIGYDVAPQQLDGLVREG